VIAGVCEAVAPPEVRASEDHRVVCHLLSPERGNSA
jgi:hypothetical protein